LQSHVNQRTYVIGLESIKERDRGVVGAKALSLARISSMGLPVPGGFCVRGTAYREHLNANDIVPQLRAALERLEHTPPKRARDVLSGIRRAVVEAPLADAIREELENHLRALGADRIAVRSSATVEDLPGHSFAGQYETYLGVADLSGCLEAIKKCWASLGTQRAYEYRRKNGFDQLAVNMAVVIQVMVPADTSGVIFTADPLSARRDRMIIEASFGLGESLVSGKVTPDRFVMAKGNLKILSHTVSEKNVERVLDERGGVREQRVDAERASAPCLDPSIARRLARFAKKVEAEFGCPQDIEWAVCGTDIFFLQSRPITTLPQAKSSGRRQIWSNLFNEEVIPDVVSPITWSMLCNLMDEFIDPILNVLCIDRGDNPTVGLIAGRVYFNISTLTAVVFRLPGMKDYDFDEVFGGEAGVRATFEKLNITEQDLPEIGFRRFRFFLKMPEMIVNILFSPHSKGYPVLAELESINAKWQRLDVSGLSEWQIAGHLRATLADFRSVLSYVTWAFLGFGTYPIFERICAKWLPEDGCCAKRLVAGLGDMDDATAGHDLWRLAVRANEVPPGSGPFRPSALAGQRLT